MDKQLHGTQALLGIVVAAAGFFDLSAAFGPFIALVGITQLVIGVVCLFGAMHEEKKVRNDKAFAQRLDAIRLETLNVARNLLLMVPSHQVIDEASRSLAKVIKALEGQVETLDPKFRIKRIELIVAEPVLEGKPPPQPRVPTARA